MLAIQSKSVDTELYINLSANSNYKYAREYYTDANSENRQITIDGTNFIPITITGIPDCVSPDANEALIPANQLKRLYIFSNAQLDENTLQSIDSFYSRGKFPIFKCDTPIALLSSLPRTNFYMVDDQPTSVSNFTEYRYLLERHIISRIVYNRATNEIYNMVLPERPLLVLIMPSNFIRTGLKQGYFHYDNNIIIRVYSRYLLSSHNYDDNDDGRITVISSNNEKLRSVVERAFNRFGIHKIITSNEYQIYGYDRFLTFVVGKISNVVMP